MSRGRIFPHTFEWLDPMNHICVTPYMNQNICRRQYRLLNRTAAGSENSKEKTHTSAAVGHVVGWFEN